MPGDPAECRNHALRCRELARLAATPEANEAFMDLAETWDRLAAELESALVFLSAMKEIEGEKSD